MKKNIIWITVIVAIAVGTYFYFSKREIKIISWRTAFIEKGDIAIVVTATGSLNPLTTVNVGAQVSGTIAKLYVDFNSVVKKGQVIALIDTVFLAATRDDAQATYEKANLDLNQSKLVYERTKKLFDGDAAVAQADYDLALTNYETAKSVVKSVQAQLNRANINLRYATIIAPVNGTVISRNVDVGQTVISSFNSPTLFTIANDLTKMQVYGNFDEADIGQIKVGQIAVFTVDAYPNESFSGPIAQIRLQPNIIQNVVNYSVIIDVPNPDLKLMPGLTANINVKVKEHKNILKIPSNALHFVPPPQYFEKDKTIPDLIKEQWKNFQVENFSEGSTAFIWTKQGETIVPHQIKIGLTDGSFTEISGNVKAQDEVVLGINKDDNSATQTKNPFMPTFTPGTRKAVR